MAEEKNDVKIDNHPDVSGFSKCIRKCKRNPWMPIAIVLALVVVLLLIFCSGSENSISGKVAGEKVLAFAAAQGVTANVVSVEDKGSVYETTLSIEGQEFPVYITKDGGYFISTLIPLEGDYTASSSTEETEQITEVPTSDKPVFDLYVFSYCPYGTQFEKALIPVYKLLKDKVEFNIVAIGAMHGEFEKQESLRQICIEDNYGKDVYFNYLEKFLGSTAIGDCSSDTSCSVPLVEEIMKGLKIDVNKINSCMIKEGETIYDQQNAQASSLGITGSPGVTINGVETSVGRSPSAVLSAVCSGFNTSPDACSETVSTTTESAGFGYGSGSSSSSASC